MLTPSGRAVICGPVSVTCAEQPAANSASAQAMPIVVRMPRMLGAKIPFHRGPPPVEGHAYGDGWGTVQLIRGLTPM
jgi:hypothetical protein